MANCYKCTQFNEIIRMLFSSWEREREKETEIERDDGTVIFFLCIYDNDLGNSSVTTKWYTFIFVVLLFHVYVCFDYIYVCTLHMCLMPMEDLQKNWEQLWAAIWVLTIEYESSRGEESALDCWFMSQDP